jgi:hypothetical protein
MSNVQNALEVLGQLKSKKSELIDVEFKTAEERQRISYDAFTGSDAAAKKLARLNERSLQHSLEMESLDAAIDEAEQRLKVAEAEASRLADIEAAKDQQRVFERLVGKYRAIGDAMDTLTELLNELPGDWEAIQKGPIATHNTNQFLVNTGLILKTMLSATPFRHEFEIMSPTQRLTVERYLMADFGLVPLMTNRFAVVLGDAEKEAA